jgi:ribosomal protein S18 acetylase RimI-like enzyme
MRWDWLVSMDLMIRPAGWDDLEPLLPVVGPPREPEASRRARLRVRLAASGRGDEELMVALVADRYLGLVSLRWVGGCDPPYPWLYGLRVVPAERGRGIGRALVEAAEAAARVRGAAVMSLDVDMDNEDAIRFYRRLGYEGAVEHLHRWRSVDPDTGAVTGTGSAQTWILRHPLERLQSE